MICFSLSLFLFCSEGFSYLVDKTDRKGRIRGLKFGRQGLLFLHLLFVYDSFVFMDANKEDGKALCEALNMYWTTSMAIDDYG